MSFHVVIAAVSVVLQLGSFFPYFRDIARGTTKPHAFSWLVWGVLNVITFAAQITHGGGPGAWRTAFTGALLISVFIASLRGGERNIARADWISLAAAAVAMILWRLTNDALTAVLLVTATDVIGSFPTFRKSFHKPFDETALTFALSGFSFLLSIFALDQLSLITAFFPAAITLLDFALVAFLLLRRAQMRTPA